MKRVEKTYHDLVSNFTNPTDGEDELNVLIFVGEMPAIETSPLSDVCRLGVSDVYEEMVREPDKKLGFTQVKVDGKIVNVFLAMASPAITTADWRPYRAEQLIPFLKGVEATLCAGVHRARLHMKAPNSYAQKALKEYSSSSLMSFQLYDDGKRSNKEHIGGGRYKITPI